MTQALPKRLVVLGGSLTALAVIRNAQSLGMETILVCHPGEIASYSRFPRVVTAESITTGLAEALTAKELDSNRSAVIATSDLWIRFIIEHRTRLSSNGGHVLQAENHILETCLNKKGFLDWAEEFDIPIPKRVSLPHPSEPSFLNEVKSIEALFPLLIRPALTHHDKPPSVVPKVVEAKDFQQLKSGLELYGNAGVNTSVSQSLLPYPLQQYSVGAACAQSGDICLFVAKKERPTPGCASVGTYMSLQPNAEVEALARSTLEKLNYFGIAEVEILRREDTGELYVIEINARPWLQYMLALRSGHDFLRFLLDNDNFQPDRARKAGYRWIDFNSDFFTAFSKSIGLVRNGDVSLQTYVTSLIRANVYARFDLRDLKPFRLGLSELRKLVK